VTLAALPVKIVSLAPSNTEILFALGAGDLLIGRDEFSDYPAEALAVPSVGSLYPSVNTEAVVALEPDLVLAAGITSPEDVQKLEDLGHCVCHPLPGTLDDGADIGMGADRPRRGGRALVADMQARVAAVKTATANVAERPSVFYEIDATDPASPFTAGPGTFNDQLITLAGGENVGNSRLTRTPAEPGAVGGRRPALIVLGSFTYGGRRRRSWPRATVGATLCPSRMAKSSRLTIISSPRPAHCGRFGRTGLLIHPEPFQ
jgi:iron complex transport system substrate-binding protein